MSIIWHYEARWTREIRQHKPEAYFAQQTWRWYPIEYAGEDAAFAQGKGTNQESGPTEDCEASPGPTSLAFPSEGTEGGNRDHEKSESEGRTRPYLIGIPQGCEADPDIEHHGHQLSESEAETCHGLSPR